MEQLTTVLEINFQSYNYASSQFEAKLSERYNGDKAIVDQLLSYLPVRQEPYRILDIGCGNGQMANLLTQANCIVDGIEFSPRMASVAQKNAPRAKIICDEFTKHQFEPHKYDGILAIAFVHLFPRATVVPIVQKIISLLKKDGIALIATTKELSDSEGLQQKKGFDIDTPPRFRHQYTKDTFLSLLSLSGFTLKNYSTNVDHSDTSKIWMNAIVTP